MTPNRSQNLQDKEEISRVVHGLEQAEACCYLREKSGSSRMSELVTVNYWIVKEARQALRMQSHRLSVRRIRVGASDRFVARAIDQPRAASRVAPGQSVPDRENGLERSRRAHLGERFR